MTCRRPPPLTLSHVPHARLAAHRGVVLPHPLTHTRLTTPCCCCKQISWHVLSAPHPSTTRPHWPLLADLLYTSTNSQLATRNNCAARCGRSSDGGATLTLTQRLPRVRAQRGAPRPRPPARPRPHCHAPPAPTRQTRRHWRGPTHWPRHRPLQRLRPRRQPPAPAMWTWRGRSRTSSQRGPRTAAGRGRARSRHHPHLCPPQPPGRPPRCAWTRRRPPGPTRPAAR
mmetsp:Transcript_14954/g.37291  ORF Transcript_14954/g.37291 Transcript_14954/m.37291 type:complete len:227 (+) Transcript_14954:1372-2052(+)